MGMSTLSADNSHQLEQRAMGYDIGENRKRRLSIVRKDKYTSHQTMYMRRKNVEADSLQDYSEDKELEAERNLVSAVLHRALLDLISKETNVYRPAYAWFMERKQKRKRRDCFSFRFCCEVLELDCKELRFWSEQLFQFVHSANPSPKLVEVEPFFERLKNHSKNGTT